MSILKEKLRIAYGKIRSFGKERVDLPHEEVIVSFASFLKPRVYVELGIYQCSLTNKMIPMVKEAVYAVDIQNEAGKFLKKSSKSNFFCGTTDAFTEELKRKDIVIDMLFIDADHRKESVLRDFKNYLPFVKEDGIIFLHDGYPKNIEQTADGYCSDCYKAIEELGKDTREYEMMTIPLHPGLTICRKRLKQVPWVN